MKPSRCEVMKAWTDEQMDLLVSSGSNIVEVLVSNAAVLLNIVTYFGSVMHFSDRAPIFTLEYHLSGPPLIT